uniref:NADH dehydrogenase subunit 5 n=1 Tax=Atkinsoniella xanthoabdomena TaxID=2930063 RepID=UPI0020012DFB|nr:NADH dehydrogenase subunit 5 [Atkinsoniella xanthoabdomena]UNZ12672.1 NADH dehydrogenase subunit 5 [Atkinsoniella xanthoabdomena]
MMKVNFFFYWFMMMMMMSVIFFTSGILFLYKDYIMLFEWSIITLNTVPVYYVILFDWISLIFSSIVLFISSMVILYSINYIGIYSYSSNRFLFLVILFIFSMILMIMSPNLVSIMLGWDGLGLVSYCLVIYYSSMSSYLAGLITCLTNRLGDIGLLVSICWLMSYGSWHFIFYENFYSMYIYYMVIISCFTKSAQIPFSCWLPAAMAAPTPVSSLVHSSTLVTAGVYLLIRFYNSFNYSNYFFLFISMMTMIFSSLCASYEFDLKKIIALSTLSQLGLMMSSLFFGMVDLSFFHLLTHAMFKSLLFLCSGIFIFYMNDNQDIRMMGSVCIFMPFTTACFNISSLTLCGIPFLSGFYSKDFLIENMSFNSLNFIVFLMFYFSLGLTACYSSRLFYYSMINNYNFMSYNFINDNFSFMKISIFILTIFSVFTGSSLMWFMNFDMTYITLPLSIKSMSLMFVFLGLWFGLEFCNFNYMFSLNYYLFNSYMWFMYSYSFFMYKLIYKSSLSSSYQVSSWGEFYGGFGFSFYLLKISNSIQYYSSNNLKIFLISFLMWFMYML